MLQWGASESTLPARRQATFKPAASSRPRGIVRAPYQVHRTKLGNGLRVCTVRTPHLHTATVALYVRAGSRYETRATNGLSHFLEHMLFRGSRQHPDSLALNLAIEELGGTLYAETGRDHALYQIGLGPHSVPGAIQILGELFTAPTFSDLRAERRLILEEVLEDFDDRGRMVNIHDLVRQEAFKDHPLAFPIVGPTRNVRRFSRTDVQRHFRRFCTANNMILCVGGDVDPPRVAAWARQAFGDLRPGVAIKPRPARPRLDGPHLRCVATDASQSHLQMVFHAPSIHDSQHPALVSLLRLIDDGMSTPLHYRVADQKGLAYHIGADNESFFDTSLFEIDASCSPAKLSALVKEVLSILQEFVDKPPDAAALVRAKRRYNDDLEASYDEVGSLCAWFGGAELFVRPATHEHRMRRMSAVTGRQVQQMAARVFDRKGMVVVASGQYRATEISRVRRLLQQF